MNIIYATHNQGKASELRQALRLFQLEEKIHLFSLEDIGDTHVPPEETGATYLENARLKARSYAQYLDLPVLADDGGLELSAFPDILGVKTQRFFTSNDPAQQNIELLNLFTDKPDISRKCTLHACLVYHDEAEEVFSEAEISGEITTPRGDDGYGFDSIIFLPKKQKTFAQLPQEERLLMSPRVQAFQKLLEMEVFK
ncbi:non-canonical purine NTP pyrophosphatase [Enterococcus sp. BWT-B8]|uniref:non-canonical purine NTP pyrophosphatase n=1 Tax=Enterococcus sp. BWT-B8 TaxID=2885157 RepID=UPI001E56D783|nr:non-canonical purine NTP pyrophosphatase [Enterococcus sp. BWT-B8]MCB5951456.1 non-canonical purine NTP pyrophosphatase [Enterococcus sp. BWT-B8]